MAKPTVLQANHLNAIPVENPTKQKTVGTELTRQTTRDLNDISNKKGNKITLHNNRHIKKQMNQKTRYAAPAILGNRSREGVLINRSPHHLYKRLNSRVCWHNNNRLAKTTSTRFYKKAISTNRTRRNLHS